MLQPVEPLVRLLKNFGIADGSANDVVRKKQLFETLVMRVTVPAHSESWGINICAKDHKQFEEIMFHFNPRRRFVAMNNREGNTWGQQVIAVTLIGLVLSFEWCRSDCTAQCMLPCVASAALCGALAPVVRAPRWSQTRLFGCMDD